MWPFERLLCPGNGPSRIYDGHDHHRRGQFNRRHTVSSFRRAGDAERRSRDIDFRPMRLVKLYDEPRYLAKAKAIIGSCD